VDKHDWAEFETTRDKWMAMMQANTQNATTQNGESEHANAQ